MLRRDGHQDHQRAQGTVRLHAKDIAHPLNNQTRQYLEERVLTVYKKQMAASEKKAEGESSSDESSSS